MSETLRDGLERVQEALFLLENDPSRLSCARMRFSRSPPYISSPSGASTVLGSPELSSGERRRKEQEEQRFRRRLKLMDEHAASTPLRQFLAQRDEEKVRIWNANPGTSWKDDSCIPIAGLEEKEAIETIKNRWVEQGIWKDKPEWDLMARGRWYGWECDWRWKHEEPLELESESETDIEAESPPPIFDLFGQKQPQPKPRRPESNDEKQRIAERRVVRGREREASRPYHQFVYQISKEREWIKKKSTNEEGADTADINTRAYENVKNTWTKRGIWNEKWGILPGMSWKHEEPLEEAADSPAFIPANPPVGGSRDAGETPTRRTLGSPTSVVSDHRQISGIMNTPQQEPSAEVDSASLENGDAERPPSASNSLRPKTSKRDLRPTTGQELQPSRKMPSHKDGQPQLVASAPLDPVHSSKALKAIGEVRPGSQRQPNTESLAQTASTPLRRSKRLRPPEPGMARGTTGTTSTDSPKGIARPSSKQKTAGNLTSMDSTKPQGTSERQRPSTTRGKARKG